jgi:hypothetical protein
LGKDKIFKQTFMFSFLLPAKPGQAAQKRNKKGYPKTSASGGIGKGGLIKL